MINKKGLSDVVTTVLMILLALAAVVILWTVLKPFFEKGGETIDEQASCFGVELSAVCTYDTSGQPTVTVTVDSEGNADADDLVVGAVVKDSTGMQKTAYLGAGETGAVEVSELTTCGTGNPLITCQAQGKVKVGKTTCATATTEWVDCTAAA